MQQIISVSHQIKKVMDSGKHFKYGCKNIEFLKKLVLLSKVLKFLKEM